MQSMKAEALLYTPQALAQPADTNYNEILPTQMSLNITQSPIRL
jgi:hypothetical protein